MTDQDEPEEIKEKIEIIDRVCELFPLEAPVERDVFNRLISELKNYCYHSCSDTMDTLEDVKIPYRKIPEHISGEFKDLDPVNLAKINNAKISFQTIGRYLNNPCSDDQQWVTGANVSIRIIAAFLLSSELNCFSYNDLKCQSFVNYVGVKLADYIAEHSSNHSRVHLKRLVGTYAAQKEDGANRIEISLDLQLSSDQSHLLIRERFCPSLVSKNKKNSHKISLSTGWAVMTQYNSLICVMKEVEDGHVFSYNLLGMQTPSEEQCFFELIALIRNKAPIQLDDNASLPFQDELFDKKISNDIFVFKKDGDLLTIPKESPSTIKNEKRALLGNTRFVHVLRRSNMSNVKHPRRDMIMDQEIKDKLSQELIECVRGDKCDFEGIDRLLEQGASVNYQDPETGKTFIHFVAAGGSAGLLESIIEKSHEGIRPLIRDGRGRLLSEVATINHAEELRPIFLKAERDAGQAIGIAALPRGNIPLAEFRAAGFGLSTNSDVPMNMRALKKLTQKYAWKPGDPEPV